MLRLRACSRSSCLTATWCWPPTVQSHGSPAERLGLSHPLVRAHPKCIGSRAAGAVQHALVDGGDITRLEHRERPVARLPAHRDRDRPTVAATQARRRPVSPPEWWLDTDVQHIGVLPGHAGVEINEEADQLAGTGASATSRIVLSVSDFQQLFKRKMELDDARKPSPEEAEVWRMMCAGLKPGWVARSGLCTVQRPWED